MELPGSPACVPHALTFHTRVAPCYHLAMRGRASLVSAFAFVAACRDSHDAPAPRPAKPPDAGAVAVGSRGLSVGKGRAFERGVARMTLGRLVVRVTDNAADCHSAVPSDAMHAIMTMEIPGGPGARFFAGSTIGLHASGAIDGERFDHRPSDNVVTISSFLLEKDARFRLDVDGPLGLGALDVQICDPGEAPRPLAENVPDMPATGIIDGHPFRVKKALATLSGGDAGASRIEVLSLYQEEVTCGHGSSAPWGLYVHRFGVGSRRPLVGSAQPATSEAINAPIERAQATSEMPTWIRFDRLRFEPGATVTGALAIEVVYPGGPPTRIAGRFEAEVCPP